MAETRRYNQSAIISSATSTAQNTQVSFLIEGFSSANDPSRFPENSAAINLAQTNKCEYFDSISSYDTEQIGTLLKNKSEEERKAILLGIYVDFSSEGNSADIIDKHLKKSYKEYFGEMPTWLNDLNPFTINSFAAEVLSSKLFNGSPEKFKLFKRSIREEAEKISDELSARRFLEYVRNREELKSVYALIGSNHLNMLNKLGKVVTEEGDYKLIKVQVGDRTIDVHLYGGRHGEMSHYESLAKRAEKDGLVVPSTPVVSEDKSMEALIKLLLSAGSFSLQRQTSHNRLSDSDEEKVIEQTERKIEQRSIAELVDQFDYWMTHYVESHKRSGDYEDNNKALISWLHNDSGYKYINNYSHFCALAMAVTQKGYKTNPPPSESAFDNAMGKISEREKPHSNKYKGTVFKSGEKKIEEKSKEKSIGELADQFDSWMRNYNHPQQEDNKHLITWLTADGGGKHIQHYEKFCKLAEELNKKGYRTSPPPKEVDFNKGIEEHTKREQQRSQKKFF